MTFIWLLVISISLLYILLIGFFYIGWLKYKVYKYKKADFSTFVSIVIAARNEENDILNLLEALSIQTYRQFEVIIIDDHSTDKTAQIIRENNFIKCNLLSLNTTQIGKKSAIIEAVSISKGELILATDADCIPSKNWVESMVSFYNSEQVEFILGPVKQRASKNFFKQLFSLDFLSLQAVGAGAAEMTKPFICNGANLAFSKKVWNNISSINGEKYASGDDVFLLHNAINVLPKEKIRFIFSDDAIVVTSTPNGVKSFFNQRIRWASKAKGYNNFISLFASIAVVLINLLLIVLLVSSVLWHQLIFLFFFVLVLKSIVDFVILFSAVGFFNQQKILWYFIPSQLVYFIYTTVISVYSLVGKYRWKDRTCR